MKANYRRGYLASFLAASILLTGLTTSVLAANFTTLKAIQIEGTKNTFKITLKTDQDTKISTHIPSKDRLVIDLEKTKASEAINTAFKNAANIDDIIIQPLSNNTTRLFITGTNISKSNIIIDKSPAISAAPVKEVIVEEPTPEPIVEEVVEETVAEKSAPVEEQGQPAEEATAETEGIPAEAMLAEDINANTVQASSVHESETTGILSGAAMAEPTTASDIFEPSADLNNNFETPPQPIPDTATQASTTASAMQTKSLLSQENMIRFGIIFVLVTLFVAYVRKEGLIKFGASKKPARKALNRDQLDIYKSLNHSTKLSPPYGNARPTRTPTGIDRKPALKSPSRAKQAPAPRKTEKPAPKNLNAKKKLTQNAALNMYTKQSSERIKKFEPRKLSLSDVQRPRNAAPQKRSPQVSTGKLNKANMNQLNTSNKFDSFKSMKGNTADNNIEFLMKMVDLYKQTGRHDLAANIEKSIQDSLSKR